MRASVMLLCVFFAVLNTNGCTRVVKCNPPRVQAFIPDNSPCADALECTKQCIKNYLGKKAEADALRAALEVCK